MTGWETAIAFGAAALFIVGLVLMFGLAMDSINDEERRIK